jgi:uncharacterized protein
MRRQGDAIILSATDLMRFQGCAHAVALDLLELRGERIARAEDSATAKLIQDVYSRLFGQRFCDRDGKERPITVADVLVVTPYNAQVNLLKRVLPLGARVGTVDKFQGQEAPACLVSMATSSGDELPRDIEFLFSVNRLNVAISRAQALAIVFASPRLLDVSCHTIDKMRLVNALCAVADTARSQTSCPA